jgi:hypothetical protein
MAMKRAASKSAKNLMNHFYVRDNGRIVDEGEGGAATLTKRT